MIVEGEGEEPPWDGPAPEEDCDVVMEEGMGEDWHLAISAAWCQDNAEKVLDARQHGAHVELGRVESAVMVVVHTELMSVEHGTTKAYREFRNSLERHGQWADIPLANLGVLRLGGGGPDTDESKDGYMARLRGLQGAAGVEVRDALHRLGLIMATPWWVRMGNNVRGRPWSCLCMWMGATLALETDSEERSRAMGRFAARLQETCKVVCVAHTGGTMGPWVEHGLRCACDGVRPRLVQDAYETVLAAFPVTARRVVGSGLGDEDEWEVEEVEDAGSDPEQARELALQASPEARGQRVVSDYEVGEVIDEAPVQQGRGGGGPSSWWWCHRTLASGCRGYKRSTSSRRPWPGLRGASIA